MTKLFVISGHGAGDPGACGNGYTEAERVRALATRIKELGGDDVMLSDFSRNYYADSGINRLDISNKEYKVVELHMDSAQPSARGGHVIIQAGIGGADEHDRKLAELMAAVFPGRAEAIVERNDLANPWRAYNRGYNYRLVENGFISNAGDVATFNSRIDDLARGYLAAFGIEAKAAQGAPAPVPAPSIDVDDRGGAGEFEAGAYRCTVNGLNVRSKPSLSGEVVAHYDKGQVVNLDAWYTIADGWVWGRYTAYSGNVRYVAVGKPTGGYDPSDYLVKV